MNTRVLMVVPSLRSGGTERVASLLCEEWRRQGHDVLMCLFDGRDAFFDPQVRRVVLALPAKSSLPGKILNFFRRSFRLLVLMRQFRPTHIVAFSEMANIPTIAAAALTANLARTVVSVRANPSRRSRFSRKVMRLFYTLPFRVVGVSVGVRDALVDLVGTDARRTVAIPNPVCLETSKERVASWGAPALLAVGRLVRPKRFDVLIEAFALVSQTFPNAELYILGEGEEREKLLELIKQLGLEKRVHLPGSSRNVVGHLAACDIFVLSSESEGWPNALAEALGAGCAVVSTDCPFGPSEMIVDGESGVLVPINDPQALADAISRIAADKQICEKLARGAMERSKLWTLAATAQRWLDLKKGGLKKLEP